MAGQRFQNMIGELERCGYTVIPPKPDECKHRGDISILHDFCKGEVHWHCYTCGKSGHDTGGESGPVASLVQFGPEP